MTMTTMRTHKSCGHWQGQLQLAQLGLRTVLAIIAISATGISGMAPAFAQQAPTDGPKLLAPASRLPSDGPAYVLGAPNGPDWLVLATREGRWLIQLDQSSCGQTVIEPDSNVRVDLDAPSGTLRLREMVLEPSGSIEPDQQACPVQDAYDAGTAPCAQIDSQCDISAERSDGAGEP